MERILIDIATSMAVDDEANVYVTGQVMVKPLVTMQQLNIILMVLSNGLQRYNGIGNRDDKANSIAIDNSGNIYVTGVSYENGTANNYATVKYNSAGVEQWVEIYDGTGSNDDYGTAVKVDNLGNVYVTGFSVGIPITSGYDYATIKYSQTPLLKITKPTPFSKFISGETDTIKWVDAGWNAVNIKCKTNFETPIESEIIIAQGIPNVNSKFVWNVPDTILSFRSKIIIENADNPTEKIESDIFRIKPYVLTRLNADSTYYEYRKNRDQWGFSNTRADVWDSLWYSQFDYQGIDPFTNQQYSQIQGDSVFFKRPSYAHMDWISWVNTFTLNACYFSVANGWYKPTATLKWWIESFPGKWNGSCFGIAVANALAFSHREQFQIKYLNFPTITNPITVVSNAGVKRVINELFTHQTGNPHLALRTLIGLNKTPNETLNDLKEMLSQDNAEIRTLSFNNNGPGGGGHAVLAYGLKHDPTVDGLYYVQIYDNSNPNSNNHIQLNSLVGNGFWAAPDWPGWGGNKWFYLRNPTEQYLVNPTFAKGVAQQSPFILDQDVLEINNTTSASIQIQDNVGNQTGFINNLIQLDIPGSAPFVFDNGSETPPYGYTLPADNYSIVLNEFIEDTVATFFFTGNKSFLYERNGADQTETDRLFFDGGVSVANPDAQTKTVKLLNLINETTQEKLFVARSLELAQNDSVKIENPDSNKIKLISYGSAKDYDIELNYVTENEFGRFGDFNIPMSANSSHTFVPNWTELTNSELQVLVDIGNDGTIDDTLYLSNQVTGTADDQGSLFTPDSYNLAQNYPNPFNPSTKISWQSPVGSHQTLKIYDILGNEVATLINEYREAGRYEVTFDASKLASGMYLYRLQAGSFVETKKMLLLK
ncbi:MAG: SBBP repeat-containing protein [Ignavibacteriales bacterium]|nr:SBBP repeat-containing protein [Ignavibacteriales bacterium]